MTLLSAGKVMADDNKKNKDKAIEVMKELAKGKAKGLLKKKVKKEEEVDIDLKDPEVQKAAALIQSKWAMRKP